MQNEQCTLESISIHQSENCEASTTIYSQVIFSISNYMLVRAVGNSIRTCLCRNLQSIELNTQSLFFPSHTDTQLWHNLLSYCCTFKSGTFSFIASQMNLPIRQSWCWSIYNTDAMWRTPPTFTKQKILFINVKRLFSFSVTTALGK